MKNYFDDLDDLRYPEICITLEDTTTSGGNVRCRVPILMPSIADGTPKDIPFKASKPNILNKDYNPITGNIDNSNYMNVYVPDYVAQTLPHNIYNVVKKGQKLIVVFIGGDITNIKVIGRY